jgi:hypothetical protein
MIEKSADNAEHDFLQSISKEKYSRKHRRTFYLNGQEPSILLPNLLKEAGMTEKHI